MHRLDLPPDIVGSREAVLRLVQSALDAGLIPHVRVLLARDPTDSLSTMRPVFGRIDLARTGDPPVIASRPKGHVRLLEESPKQDLFVARLRAAFGGAPLVVSDTEVIGHGMEAAAWNGFRHTWDWRDYGAAWPCVVLAPWAEIPQRPWLRNTVEADGAITVFDGLEPLVRHVSGFVETPAQGRDTRFSRFQILIWDYRGRIDRFQLDDRRLVVGVSPAHDDGLRLVGVISGERERTTISEERPDKIELSLPEPVLRATVELKRGDEILSEERRDFPMDALLAALRGESAAPSSDPTQNTLSEVTRRGIVDWFALEGVRWSGRLDDVEFLDRLFDLQQMPSGDGRFGNAAGDIWQHRINNPTDWSDDWVFHDGRFDLLASPDETFLRFLCETIHPAVRPDTPEARSLASAYNDMLRDDWWELFEATTISRRPIFQARRVGINHDHVMQPVQQAAQVLNSQHLDEQIRRMAAAVGPDPTLAIGTAKELVETFCKAILLQRNEPADPNWEVPQLTKATAKVLGLLPDDIPESAKGVDAIRVLLSNLASVTGRLAELRNLYGTGHGKRPDAKGLEPRHARLAVGSAAVLVTFLFETHLARPKS